MQFTLNPVPGSPQQLYGVEYVSLEDALRQADFVSINAPSMPETRHLINERTLALMKPTAFLVNTARGGIVHEGDLLEALKAGRLAGAALDVFEEEPPPKDHPLFRLPNVVLTAHTAGVDWKSLEDMAVSAARAVAALSRGTWPAEQVVNPEVRGRWRW